MTHTRRTRPCMSLLLMSTIAMVTGSRCDLRVSGPRWCDAAGATRVEPVHAGTCGHAGDTFPAGTRDACALVIESKRCALHLH